MQSRTVVGRGFYRRAVLGYRGGAGRSKGCGDLIGYAHRLAVSRIVKP